jgi:hypothetical protein
MAHGGSAPSVAVAIIMLVVLLMALAGPKPAGSSPKVSVISSKSKLALIAA